MGQRASVETVGPQLPLSSTTLRALLWTRQAIYSSRILPIGVSERSLRRESSALWRATEHSGLPATVVLPLRHPSHIRQGLQWMEREIYSSQIPVAIVYVRSAQPESLLI